MWRGRNISSFSSQPQENEVLLPPSSTFTVTGCIDAGNGLCIVSLTETEPVELLLEYGLEDPNMAMREQNEARQVKYNN